MFSPMIFIGSLEKKIPKNIPKLNFFFDKCNGHALYKKKIEISLSFLKIEVMSLLCVTVLVFITSSLVTNAKHLMNFLNESGFPNGISQMISLIKKPNMDIHKLYQWPFAELKFELVLIDSVLIVH